MKANPWQGSSNSSTSSGSTSTTSQQSVLGSRLVGSRGAITTNVGNGTDLSTTGRTRHVCPSGCVNPRVAYANVVCNTGGSEAVASTPITIAAAIEYPQGVVNQCSWNGATTVTAAVGAFVTSDPIAIEIPAGAIYWVRTTSFQSGGTVWPANVLTVSSGGAGTAFPGADGDCLGGRITTATLANPCVLTMTGHSLPTGTTPITIKGAAGLTQLNANWTATYVDANRFSVPLDASALSALTNQATLIGSDLTKPGSGFMIASGGANILAPCALLGDWPAGTKQTGGAKIGDSVDNGSGDTSVYGAGWLTAALGTLLTPTMPLVSLSVQGTRASMFADLVNAPTQSIHRRQFLGLPYVSIGFGINDYVSGAQTQAVTQAAILAIATSAAARGSRVIIRTLTPQTTSTDAWATAGNQTPTSAEANRVAHNNWVRAGAPIDPTTKVAVAVGTVGALTAGSVGHPVWSIVDPWINVEVDATNTVVMNGGRWLTTGAASYPTTDGIHPTTAIVAITVPVTQATLVSKMVPF